MFISNTPHSWYPQKAEGEERGGWGEGGVRQEDTSRTRRFVGSKIERTF